MIFITGANGFTGRHVYKELRKRGIPFIAFARDSGNDKWLKENYIEIRYGDINNTNSLTQALKDCRGLINLVSLVVQMFQVLLICY